MSRILALAMCALALTGCTSYSTLSPSGDGRVEYDGGLPILTSKGASSIVRLMPGRSDYETGKRIGLIVSVVNPTPDRFDFDTSNVTATSELGLVHVYSYDQIVAEIQRDAKWQAVAQALNAASQGMQAADAGYSNSYTSGSIYGYGGSATYNATTTTYDQGAAQAAQARVNAESRQRMAEIATNRDNNLKAAESLIRRTTLSPGEAVTGRIVVDAPKGTPKILHIAVDVAGDHHEFSFNYLPIG